MNPAPGLIGGCVMKGTPSMLLGTITPWKWTAVLWGSSLLTTKRTLSPSVTRISGPGTTPLYAKASANLPGWYSHCTTLAIRLKTLTSPSITGGSRWPPSPPVGAGNDLTPASCIASISSAVIASWFADVAVLVVVEPIPAMSWLGTTAAASAADWPGPPRTFG